MKKYFYLTPDGHVRSEVTLNDNDLPASIEGLTAIESSAIVPPAPDAHSAFQFSDLSWVDPRTLLQLKDAKWEDIKVVRDRAITAPLVVGFNIFDADEKASLNITKAVLLAQTLSSYGQTVAIDFTLANNTVVTLDAGEMVKVGFTLAAREQQVRAYATTLRAQIQACINKTELISINWELTNNT